MPKFVSDVGFFIKRDFKTRESRFAVELAKRLDERGCLLQRADFREIQRAFERHFRIVQKASFDAMIQEIKK
jgi:hypothetical protein